MIQFKHNKVYTNIHDAFIWNGYKQPDIMPINPIQSALAGADSVKERIEAVQNELLKMPQASTAFAPAAPAVMVNVTQAQQ